MTDPIILGTADESPLEVDLERLIGSHLGIVANSGGGKSGLIRKLLEATAGRIQHIVLDSEDEFYTLRERHDYVIAGGDGGDTPATLENAEQLAIGALTHGFSLICQINDLGRGGANEFIDRFLSAMIAAPKELWHPCLVVIDEVQRFDETAIGKLTGEGRKRGFTAVLATQRLPKMDANVRGDLNNWIMGRVGQSLDRRHMADQLGMPPSGQRALATIEPRHFYAFGPALSRDPVLFRVGDVETTMVRPGQAKVHTPPPPEALREILAGLVPAPAEDLKGQDDFPAAHISDESLKHRVADLETERDALREIVERKNERIEKAEADRDEWKSKAEHYSGCINAAVRALGFRDIEEIGRDLDDKRFADELKPARIPAINTGPAELANGGGDDDTEIAPAKATQGRPTGDSRRPTSPRLPKVEGELGGLARRFLTEIEARHPARLSWEQWAALVQRKPKGAQFNNAKAELRSSGRIDEDEKGVRAVVQAGVPQSRTQVIEAWRRVLPGMALKVFDAVLAGGNGSYADVAARIDRQPQGAQWNSAISQLRNNGLIADRPGQVVLIDLLPGESR